MANTFPAAIANEPPPCMSSEDEDSEEFRSHGLKLDVPSGDPTPVSTPLKKPAKRSTEAKHDVIESTTVISSTRTFTNCDENSSSGNNYKNDDDEYGNFTKENGTGSPDSANHESRIVNGTTEVDEHRTDNNKVVVVNHNNEEDLSESLESENIIGEESTEGTSASEELDAANEICDSTIANNFNIFEQNQSPESSELQFVDSSSPFKEEKNNKNDPGETIASSSSSPSITLTKINDYDDEPEQQQTDSQIITNNFEQDNLDTCEPISSNKSSLDENDIEASKVWPSIATVVEEAHPKQPEPDFDDDDDDFGDFGAFQSVPSSSSTAVATENKTVILNPVELKQQSDDFDDEDDDFGDFAQFPVQAQSTSEKLESFPTGPLTPAAQKSLSLDNDNDEDDFADFQDCSFKSSVPTTTTTAAPQLPLSRSNSITTCDISLIPSKVESIVKSLFAIDPSSLPDSSATEEVKLKSIDSEISISKDEVWSRVQDFEGSQGLTFKWLNSLTETRLLRSLKIDNSNIMYHEKWGSIEVPKFAASLVMSPLQPVSCSQIPNTPSTSADSSQNKTGTRNVTVNNNNIIDGISCQSQDKPATISAEAQEILRQLPDLSYMRATTLVFPQTSPSGI